MRDPSPTEMILMPSLKATKGAGGGLVLTKKYLSGAAAFARHWPGQLTNLVELSSVPTTDMDHIEVLPGESETRIELRPENEEALAVRLRDVAVVLAFLSPFELPLAQLCKRLGVPIVFVSEYSTTTESQIMRTQTRNPILRLRRQLWLNKADRVRQEALQIAAGLQCSGTPTYEAYAGQTPSNLLFFDNRVPEADVISEADLDLKIQQMQRKAPLRLAFGGRLIAMKGVQDLPKFANILRDRDVPFTLDIYGDGPLKAALEKQIAAKKLGDQVKLRGAMDFATGWIPTLKRDVDLFICCHPQGDPSSTYPEVMACGVPIAGYDNEALRGIIAHSQGGWATPSGDLSKLADVVVQADQNRAQLGETARNAHVFAARHAFEKTMARRGEHLVSASRLCAALKADAAT